MQNSVSDFLNYKSVTEHTTHTPQAREPHSARLVSLHIPSQSHFLCVFFAMWRAAKQFGFPSSRSGRDVRGDPEWASIVLCFLVLCRKFSVLCYFPHFKEVCLMIFHPFEVAASSAPPMGGECVDKFAFDADREHRFFFDE